MTREQRFRYQMFVRVREFGKSNQELFPATSAGGELFARVTVAVATMEDQLKNRVVARADAQKVKRTTRGAVLDYMKAIAQTGRRLPLSEVGMKPFKMPRRRAAASVLSAARVLMQEAEKREEQFVRLGLPPTFISDFQKVVNDLDAAVNLQLNSRAMRRRAQDGLEAGLADAFDAVRTLDAVIANQLRRDPVGLAAWTGARRIDGLRRASHRRGPASPIQPGAIIDPLPGISGSLRS